MKKEYDLKKLEKRSGRPRSSKAAAKVPISIRLDGSILALLKSEAHRLGMPYQTLIGSILHQYATGELIEKKSIEILKKIGVA